MHKFYAQLEMQKNSIILCEQDLQKVMILPL